MIKKPPHPEQKDKQLRPKEIQVSKKEQEIDSKSNDEVLNELKAKKLPTQGTPQERKNRLKKAMGILPLTPTGETTDPPKKTVATIMEEKKQKREDLHNKIEEERKAKQEKIAKNEELGIYGDVDYENMIAKSREQLKPGLPFISPENLKIIVCVRKRPIFKKDLANREVDCVTCRNPTIYVHQCKFKVDGITKYLDNNSFDFDNSFGESNSSTDFYKYSVQPLINLLFNKGTVTCFAYGQTGSGKTYTMVEVQKLAITDMFNMSKGKYTFSLSFFEIYSGKLFDLLNGRAPLAVLEDQNQIIQVQGLEEKEASSPADMIKIIDFANSVRTTHATTSNDTSSRSHAVCHIYVKENKKKVGKLSLVDLAGSEKAQDCQNNDRIRRMEGAEINKSLLALKECIRALDAKESHVPFRASKLTMVLRDSFIGRSNKIRIIMIACVSPGSTSSEHTTNTLRYAIRLKEHPISKQEYEKIVLSQKNKVGNAPTIPIPVENEKEEREEEEQIPIKITDIEGSKSIGNQLMSKGK